MVGGEGILLLTSPQEYRSEI